MGVDIANATTLLERLTFEAPAFLRVFGMKPMKWRMTVLWFVLVSAAMMLVACGGGGSDTTGGTRSVRTFVSDTFADDYQNVFGTLYRVELLTAANTPATIYDSTTGSTYDFKQLGDTSGSRFAFLANAVVANETYTQVRVVVGATMQIVPTGGTNANTVNVVGDGPAAGGKVTITRMLATPVTFGVTDDFVLDFDLANFTIAGSNVTPAIRRNNGNGLDDTARHEEDDIKGTVSGLTGTVPNQQFTLTRLNDSVTVFMDANTTVFNSNGASNPAVANGQVVEVYGLFNTARNGIVATKVKIEDGNGGDDNDEAEGATSEVNATAGTFRITYGTFFGFDPKGSFVKIETTTNTVYRANSGAIITKAEFFTAIGETGLAEAEGTFNPTTNTLVATKVKVEDEGTGGGGGGGGAGEKEAKGGYVEGNATAGTLLISVFEYEGWSFPGGNLSIRTSGSTEYKNANNENVTKAAFFALLNTNVDVKVHGTLDGATTINARELRILD